MASPTDETLRVRSYLVTQANKLSMPELVKKVREDTAPLRAIGAAVPGAHFAERPGPDDWSPAEVYTHIVQVNESGVRAIEGILDEGAAPPPLTDTISGETRADLETAEDYWRVYRTRREPLLERVMRASGDERLDIKITHNQFGPLAFGDDLDLLIAPRKPGFAFEIGAMGSRDHNFYKEAYARQGYGAVVEQVQALWLDRRRDEAAALIPDEFVLQANLLGTEEMVRQRIRIYRDAGITTLHVSPQGETLAERLATLGQFMDLVRSVNAEEPATPTAR